MIYEVKDGDFVVLPKKLKMNGVNFDIIGIQENRLLFADKDKYSIHGKLLVERLDRRPRRHTIFIEHNEFENMKSQLKKYFKNLPEPEFYYGKKIVTMEIVEEDL